MKMENILWIDNIVKNTTTPPLLTNFKIDMVDFVDPHKVFVRRNAFWASPSPCDGVESECTKVESERLKRQFSQLEGFTRNH
jgi:hypothetical protein